MFDEIRIQQLADNIHQDLKLLKEYEDELRYTSEPRLKGKYEREIQRQRASLAHNQKEYDDTGPKEKHSVHGVLEFSRR